jgi:plasmid stabilization system protein ParE
MSRVPHPLFVAVLCIASWLATNVAAEPPKTKIDLASNGIGAPPTGFEFWQGGQGEAGQWTVVRDPTAIAAASIEQSSADATDDRYSLAIYQPVSTKNIAVSAHVKIMRGRMQSAGLAVRFVNPEHYYVLRVSALEERIDLIRVLNGKMERIAGMDADVVRERWHSLGIRVEGERFIAFLDGRLVFEAFDRALLREGNVALWTEEDNVTRFEEIEISALPFSTEDH